MRDRSKLGGALPACVTDPTPAAGEVCSEWFLIDEDSMQLEVRLYDGLSTGIFLDQSANRSRLKTLVAQRRAKTGNPVRVLNTFSYTCAFSVATALGGAETTSVDVSARYLEWGKRNFAHNGLDASVHRFAKMGTFEFLEYAKRKNLTYDMIVLDPPSYASGSKKSDVRSWSSVSDYRKLIAAAREALNPEGLMFASTNTQELCVPGRLQAEVRKGLNKEPRYIELPALPYGFAKEKERFCALLFAP
jgi:23S rRNA (cytosine1962-C5)-methyltransferase